MTRCPVSQAEIDNDQPYRSHNRDAIEEHDRAMDSLRIERREFIEKMLKHGYADVKNGRNSETHFLTTAIKDIRNDDFWSTEVEANLGSGKDNWTIGEIHDYQSCADYIVELYMEGKLPQWHAEIHKQVVLLADMALGEA